MSVALCDRCAPLLGRRELDTPAKLAVELCLPCKAKLGAAYVGTSSPTRAKASRFLLVAVEASGAAATIVGAVDLFSALVESTAEQIGEAVRLPKARRRRRRRRKKAPG